LSWLPSAQESQRLYRLTDLSGAAHPELDDIYDSFETAWQDAQGWWLHAGDSSQAAMAIGVEVSTPSGHWRTLHYQWKPNLRT
jgi:hypothetical protein